MSKYNRLGEYIRDKGEPSLMLTFDEIKEVAGVDLDHSF